MKTSAPANAATSTGLTFETLLLVARPSRFLPRLLTGAATLTLAGTFAYAGIEKLLAPAEFASAIARDAALLAGAVALLHFNPQPNISK